MSSSLVAEEAVDIYDHCHKCILPNKAHDVSFECDMKTETGCEMYLLHKVAALLYYVLCRELLEIIVVFLLGLSTT